MSKYDDPIRVIQKEVHDENGNLLHIEITEFGTGKHLVDVLWDPHDEQTQERREDFRRWVSRVLRSRNLEPVN